MPPGAKVLALDAMGVIYRVGDDVVDLLVPFVREHSRTARIPEIKAAYLDASLGKITSAQFWMRVGVSPDLEDEYLSRFELSDGLHELLSAAPTRFERVVCLSNDVSEWSKKLRQNFKLEPCFQAWYISGDLGCRKPDLEIYQKMLDDLAVEPFDVCFVDDRPKNLHPAARLGINTVCYAPESYGPRTPHSWVFRLQNLLTR